MIKLTVFQDLNLVRIITSDLLFLYYDSSIFTISKSDSGSSHYSIFKELSRHKKTGSAKVSFINTPLVTVSYRPLTSQFYMMKNTRVFHSLMNIRITKNAAKRSVTRGFNLASIRSLSNHFSKFFQVFFKNFCQTRFQQRAAWDFNLAVISDLSNALSKIF